MHIIIFALTPFLFAINYIGTYISRLKIICEIKKELNYGLFKKYYKLFVILYINCTSDIQAKTASSSYLFCFYLSYIF